jgi:hypothetical protein
VGEQSDVLLKGSEQVQISTKRRLRLKSVSIPKNELPTCRREKTEAVRNKPSSKKPLKQEFVIRISPPK